MISRTILGIIFILITVTVQTSAYDLPQWNPGMWWDLDSFWSADFNTAIPAELDFFEQNCRYSITGIETRQLQQGSQSFHDVYVIEYSGLLYGDGHIHWSDPFPLTLAVRVPDTQVTGEVLVDTETLHIMSWSRTFNGIFESLQGNEWEQIGEISVLLTKEWDPSRKLCQFPLELNDTWSDMNTMYWFGDYRLYADLFSNPVNDIQSFNSSSMDSYSALAETLEEVNALQCVRVVHTASEEQSETVWYSPDAGWNARFRSSGTAETGKLFLVSWEYDILEYGDEPATPEPTRTPVPPTVTPTRPPPTDPPPTPTGTQPTPTATYTLPPWIPPTWTPTAGPPTPTPTPPQDRPSIYIQSNQPVYHAGDHMILTTTITNPTGGIFIMEYIIFELDGAFWFWPEWGEDVTGKFRIIPGESSYPDEVIMEFDWPEIPMSIEDLTFWAIMTVPTGFEIIGDFGFCTFSYL
jgi:hypothetical protein